MQNLQGLLKLLVESPLDFVIVGGFAAVLHGCLQTTRDVDICLALSNEELQSLRQVLSPLHPKHRMRADKISFLTFPEEFIDVKNIYLETDLGALDIISNVEAVGGYYDVLKSADEIELYGARCYLISLDDLIRSKKAMGRHRDLAVVEELGVIRELMGKR